MKRILLVSLLAASVAPLLTFGLQQIYRAGANFTADARSQIYVDKIRACANEEELKEIIGEVRQNEDGKALSVEGGYKVHLVGAVEHKRFAVDQTGISVFVRVSQGEITTVEDGLVGVHRDLISPNPQFWKPRLRKTFLLVGPTSASSLFTWYCSGFEWER